MFLFDLFDFLFFSSFFIFDVNCCTMSCNISVKKIIFGAPWSLFFLFFFMFSPFFLFFYMLFISFFVLFFCVRFFSFCFLSFQVLYIRADQEGNARHGRSRHRPTNQRCGVCKVNFATLKVAINTPRHVHTSARVHPNNRTCRNMQMCSVVQVLQRSVRAPTS